MKRGVFAVRAAYGALLLAAPRPLLRALARRPADAHATLFARVLGARQLAEALLTRGDAPVVAALGAAVDGIHALTALGLALRLPARRRLALANALVAAGFTVEGLLRARAERTGGATEGETGAGTVSTATPAASGGGAAR